MKKTTVAPATEIVVSLMSHYADSAGNDQLQSDPRTYIYKTTHINIPEEVDLAVVQNTGGVVNLVLPYYDVVQKTTEMVADTDLDSISGGYADEYVVSAAELAAELALERAVFGDRTPEYMPCCFGMDVMQHNEGAFNLGAA